MTKTISPLFTPSLLMPKALAQYRLLSIGVVMRYVFLFITLITLSAFTHFLLGFTADDGALQTVKHYMTAAGLAWIVYPFAFLFLFVSNTLLIMAHISLLAAVVFFLMKAYPVRAQYRQVWRIAALAMTWHYIAYSIAPFLPNNTALYIIALTVTFLYAVRAAMHFPRARTSIAK